MIRTVSFGATAFREAVKRTPLLFHPATHSTEDDSSFIGFRVSKNEAEKIREAADQKQRSVSEYCRAAAVDGCIVNVDFNFLWRYMNELSKTNRLLEQTIYTIHETGTYHPQDLTNIQKARDLVVEQQKQINDMMVKTMKKAQKEIRAARRNLK